LHLLFLSKDHIHPASYFLTWMFNRSFRFLVESTPKLHFLGDFSLLLVFLIFHNHFYQWLELFANELTVSVIDYLSLPCISGKPFLFHFISHCNRIVHHIGGFQSNQFARLIMVKTLKMRSLFPFLWIFCGRIKSRHILFQGWIQH
jgi:hypothetical protein